MPNDYQIGTPPTPPQRPQDTSAGLGPILRGLPNIGQGLQDQMPQLALMNWLRSAGGMSPGLSRMLQQLFPQVMSQYQTDVTNVFAPTGQKQALGEFGAQSLMPYGTGEFSDIAPLWTWLSRTNPQSLYSMLTGQAAPGGQQMDLGYRKSRF